MGEGGRRFYFADRRAERWGGLSYGVDKTFLEDLAVCFHAETVRHDHRRVRRSTDLASYFSPT